MISNPRGRPRLNKKDVGTVVLERDLIERFKGRSDTSASNNLRRFFAQYDRLVALEKRFIEDVMDYELRRKEEMKENE